MINIPIALLLYIKLVHDKKTPAGATSSLTGTCIWLVHYSVFKAAPVFLLTDKPIAEFDKRAFKQEQFCASFM